MAHFSQSRLLPHIQGIQIENEKERKKWKERKKREENGCDDGCSHQSQVVKSNTISLLTSKEKCVCVFGAECKQQDNICGRPEPHHVLSGII